MYVCALPAPEAHLRRAGARFKVSKEMISYPNYLSQLTGVFGHPVAENPTIVLQEAAFRVGESNWR